MANKSRLPRSTPLAKSGSSSSTARRPVSTWRRTGSFRSQAWRWRARSAARRCLRSHGRPGRRGWGGRRRGSRPDLQRPRRRASRRRGRRPLLGLCRRCGARRASCCVRHADASERPSHRTEVPKSGTRSIDTAQLAERVEVEPDELEPATGRTNARRTDSTAWSNAMASTSPNGTPLPGTRWPRRSCSKGCSRRRNAAGSTRSVTSWRAEWPGRHRVCQSGTPSCPGRGIRRISRRWTWSGSCSAILREFWMSARFTIAILVCCSVSGLRRRCRAGTAPAHGRHRLGRAHRLCR